MVSLSGQPIVRLQNNLDGNELHVFDAKAIKAITMSENEDEVNTLQVWDLHDGRCLFSYTDDYIAAWACDPQEKRVVIASTSGIRIFNIKRGIELAFIQPWLPDTVIKTRAIEYPTDDTIVLIGGNEAYVIDASLLPILENLSDLKQVALLNCIKETVMLRGLVDLRCRTLIDIQAGKANGDSYQKLYNTQPVLMNRRGQVLLPNSDMSWILLKLNEGQQKTFNGLESPQLRAGLMKYVIALMQDAGE